MSATDVLRRLLDERGVKWHTYIDDDTVHTTWNDAACWFTELEDGTTVWGEAMEGSPADAIEATLGREECEIEYVSDWMGWHCKSCDALWQGLKDQPPRFCKERGRRVKQ